MRGILVEKILPKNIFRVTFGICTSGTVTLCGRRLLHLVFRFRTVAPSHWRRAPGRAGDPADTNPGWGWCLLNEKAIPPRGGGQIGGGKFSARGQ